MNELLTLALLLFLAVSAQVIASRFSPSAAILEILFGLAVGEVLGIRSMEIPWFAFLSMLAGVGLTFLAGSKMEHAKVRGQWRSSLPLSLASFLPVLIAVPPLLHHIGGGPRPPLFWRA